MIVYADTSFLVSLYDYDANSAAAAACMKRVSSPLLLTPLAQFEFENALALRLFRRDTTASGIKTALALMRDDIESGILKTVNLKAAVFERGRQLARRYTPTLGTRALDVLHVAAALVLHADTFLTFDLIQAKLARAQGLRVL